MKNIINSLWKLPRDLVSDGYDEALMSLADMVPMTIHEYPTGTECFTWIVPEKWTCREARLETMEGETIISHRDNPLHVVSYSLPFSGVVDRETLLSHLYSRPDLPEAIPFVFKYYQRDWGLCCSHAVKESLTDEKYKVVIDTQFTPGNLKVGEVVVEGEEKDTYVFCAHLCHPAQTNDDLAGVAVGIDVFRELLQGPRPRYTYRLLILPETIGSAAWLSHNEDLIPEMKGGLFLEMLGTPHPHALQLSNSPESPMDVLCKTIVREADDDMWTGDFLKVILNDERMFNAPGIHVPMLSLSRVRQRDDIYHPPYDEYHTSLDTPDSIHWDNLHASRQLTMDIIKAVDSNFVPLPLFKGELFCSRFKRIDYSAMFKVINAVTYKMDGKRSVADIANESNLPFSAVKDFIEILMAEGLVEKAQ